MNNQSKLQRLLCVAVCFFCIGIMTAFAQEQKVTVELKNATLKQVFKSIEGQTTYRFSYRNTLVDDKNDITISKRQVGVSVVLNEALKGRNLKYTIVSSKSIVISDKAEQASPSKTKRVSGTVKSASGESIIGANVKVTGTTIGCITDIDGNFTLEVPEDGQLIVSYIGFQTLEVPIGGKSSLSIVLKEDLEMLDEVVVVGYGTQKKVNLTGAVTSVSSDKLSERVQTNVMSSIQGVVPGVTVVNSPNGGVSINFRGRGNLGTSAPLYVIDGVVSDASFFSNLNPNSIESISFLKDAASAAIYGARAAYGVILVTTKKGKEGKINITYDGYVGMNMPTYLPETVNSHDYAMLVNEGAYNRNMEGGKYQVYSEAELQKFQDGSDPDFYPNTNWIDLALRKHVLTTQHTLGISGGTEKLHQYTNVGYVKEDNIQRGQSKTRYNFSTNIGTKVTNWMEVNANMKYYHSDGLREGGSVYWGAVLYEFPTYVAKHSDGTYGSIEGGNTAAQKLIQDNILRTIESGDWGKSTQDNILFDVGMILTPIKSLRINASMVYNTNMSKSKSYTALKDDVIDFSSKKPIAGTGNTVNQMSVSWSNPTRLQYILNATYSWTKNIHDIKILLGTSYEHYKYEGVSASRKNFPIDGLEDLNAGSSVPTDISNGGGMSENKLLSYYGRLNYSLKEKYLFECNLRADASSSFHPDNRWGYFPSISGAWRISEESFMKSTRDWLDNLKLRVSYGTLGNINNVGYYDYFQSYTIGNGYNFNDTQVSGISELKPANTSLSWETVELTDIGLDIDLFGGKWNILADYYIKNTSDILLPFNVPTEVGVSTKPSQNIAEVKNKGFELAISHQNKIGDFSYAIGANIATNKNEIIKLSGTDRIVNNGDIVTIWNVGESIGSFYGLKTAGLYTQEEIDAGHYYKNGRVPNAGDVKYVPNRPDLPWGSSIDINEDRVIIGKEVPDFTYGINFNLGWRNFEFSLLGQGVSGTKVAMAGNMYKCLPNTPREFQLKRWTIENPDPNAVYPRIYGGVGGLDQYNQDFFSDRNLFDGDYFRFKTMTLSYSLPKKLISKAGMSTLKLYITGENLLTIRADKVAKDFDPETTSGFSPLCYGIKSLAFGVNVSF